ncbi:MAG: nucleotidyltransferase family protein [Alphaproteobacteria bacterium]
MTEAEFIEVILANPANRALLDRLPDLGLSDAWLVSGALFQTAWNHLTGRPPGHGIKDYDIFYFDDTDLSWEAEDAVIKRAADLFADLDVEIEMRNQARVHLWYESHFGVPYPLLASSREGIDRFLAKACMVGVQPGAAGPDLYAPAGLEDIVALIIRPNLTANFDAGHYRAKAARWTSCWPELRVIEAT